VGLIIEQGLSPVMRAIPPILGLAVVNNHYSEEKGNDLMFVKYEEAAYKVAVRIVSGDAGNLRFNEVFRVQFQPQLLLSPWSVEK
jgi:hypothetical protein